MADKHHPSHTNRLAAETSPYLLQHRHNPVDWYPWGPEAFDRARREGRPIFLSVGYSTCYWCHVMERQSFETPAIAEVMNRLFVCIKVDREERPDVDQLYMTAVQLISRQGGWPMSVFLTPDLQPFFGGTYYPPADAHGRPGFPRICQAVHDAWTNRRADVDESCEQILSLLKRMSGPTPVDEDVSIDLPALGSLLDRSVADYEPHFGGFGRAPKFPRQTVVELLLTYLASDQDETSVRARTPSDRVRRMVLHTLDAMMHGGIRDHLGGGFHRYSTDAKWLVPHFEIMLYDNTMLLTCYAEAYRQTGDPRYARVSRDIADFVLREMTDPAGSFYTAMDAEVDGQEGLNYLWLPEQVVAELGEADAARFNDVYGLNLGPNFADPHHGNGLADKNILYVAEPGATPADSPLLDDALTAMRLKLLAARHRRKQPLLDTKVLTSWNALMIRGLAVAGRILKEPNYLEAAARCADFLLTRHRTADGGLYRTSRDGAAKYAGFLDDYAYLAWAMTDLAEASGDGRWRDEAAKLMEQVAQRFGDDDRMAGEPADVDLPRTTGGYYFTDRSADDLIVRQKTASDSPLPSGNAAAAMAWQALGRPDEARAVIAAFVPAILEQGEAMGSMVQAAMAAVLASGPVTSSPAGIDDAGEPRPDSPAQLAAGVVTATARWMPGGALAVTLSVKDGWHVNAHDPGVAGLVGLSLSVAPADAVADVEYPAGEVLQAAFAAEPVRVYAGRFDVRARLARPLATGESLAVTVRYQACDDARCLPPASVTVSISKPV